MEIPRLGVKCELQLPAYTTATVTPDPSQVCDLTTAYSNTGSLTHWARPEIGPVSSWILVRFINCWATKRTLKPFLKDLSIKLPYLVLLFPLFLEVTSVTSSWAFWELRGLSQVGFWLSTLLVEDPAFLDLLLVTSGSSAFQPLNFCFAD